MNQPSVGSTQHGNALMALAALLVLGGILLTLSSFGFTKVRVDRDRATNEALARAKDALIAYAVSDLGRPGELPCPDVNDDGKIILGEDMVGSACTSLIGRLPWVTLGLPDLRDDAGERLWYALSNDFHANGTVPLNSDTAYRAANVSLSIIGAAPAANLVAVVFSAGATLRRADGVQQARGCTVGTDCDATFKCTTAPATVTAKCNPMNYLDLDSGEDNANLANRIFVSATRSEAFNDRLMPVFSDDIMHLVERRAARQLVQHLRDHFNAWENSIIVAGANKGFYPFAVPWNDPSSTPAQFGTDGTMSGLLPLTTAAPVWSNVSAVCSGNGTTTLQCNTLVVCILGICVPGSVSGQVDNIATRFVDPPTAASFTLLGLNLGGGPNWTLNKAQRRLEFTYSGIVAAGVLNIQVSAPPISSWVGGWLGSNNWQQNAYYAFAPGFAIDGADVCGPPCFTVNNTGAVSNDNHAVVAMTGRSLSAAGQSPRPVAPVPANFNEFLEGANAAAGTVFERNARVATFNDTPVGVKP